MGRLPVVIKPPEHVVKLLKKGAIMSDVERRTLWRKFITVGILSMSADEATALINYKASDVVILEAEIQERDAKIAELERKIDDLESANASQRDNLAQLVERTHEQAARIAELELQLLDAELATGDALNQLDDAEATAKRIAELEAKLAITVNQYQLDRDGLHGSIDALLAENCEKDARIAELEREVEAQKIEMFAVQSAAGNIIHELETQLKQEFSIIEARDRRIAELERQLDGALDESSDRWLTINIKQNRIEELEHAAVLVDSYTEIDTTARGVADKNDSNVRAIGIRSNPPGVSIGRVGLRARKRIYRASTPSTQRVLRYLEKNMDAWTRKEYADHVEYWRV